MESRRLRFLLISNLVNIRYLTGFSGSAGLLLIGSRNGILWVDPRYTLQAQEQAKGVEVIEEKAGLLKSVARWFRKSGVREIGFEASNLTFAHYQYICKEAGDGIRLTPAGDLVEDLRAVKDKGEIEAIRRAGRLTADVFTELLPHIRPRATEQDLAAEIEYRMRKHGAEGVAFETIVASGARSAYPHARPSCKPLQECELVIFDLGAILTGYAADMTRTVFLGEPSRRVKSLYLAVLDAQRKAVRSVKDSAPAGAVDSAARATLAKHRLARYFTHSTGHGVGLEIHERPRLGKGETARLKAGYVVTVEPGIYLEGLGGIRIEDTVLVGSDGVEILTPASKENWIIG